MHKTINRFKDYWSIQWNLFHIEQTAAQNPFSFFKVESKFLSYKGCIWGSFQQKLHTCPNQFSTRLICWNHVIKLDFICDFFKDILFFTPIRSFYLGN